MSILLNYLDEEGNPLLNTKNGPKTLLDTEITEKAEIIPGYLYCSGR